MSSPQRLVVWSAFLISTVSCAADAPVALIDPPPAAEGWTDPYEPFRLVGNVYYVGTYDLAVYLITTPDGHILINTGLAGSGEVIRSNVESLGFSMRDVEFLLATHAHWDHVAALAEVKRLTGAQLLMHEGDVQLLEDGGNSDYLFGGRGPMFEPVRVDRALQDGSVVSLGDVEITVHHNPGHTRGASSFTFVTRDDQRSYDVLIINMGTVNEGTRLVNNPSYPGIADEYARTFREQKLFDPDVFFGSHASQFELHRKRAPGDSYNPSAFVDPEGLRMRIADREQFYLDQIQQERISAAP